LTLVLSAGAIVSGPLCFEVRDVCSASCTNFQGQQDAGRCACKSDAAQDQLLLKAASGDARMDLGHFGRAMLPEFDGRAQARFV
jgi:hypothetical protein